MDKQKIENNDYAVFRFFWISILLIITGFLYLLYKPYLVIPEEARHVNTFLHPILKPSGTTGHALGIIGGALMVFCYILYFLRKRVERFEKWGELSLWLEIHIFLGLLGPVLILFHSALKFNGIIGLGFWIMIVVVISGIFGRIFFGKWFWNITKNYEMLQTLDLFIESDLKQASLNSPLVKRIVELEHPGFPTTKRFVEIFQQWRAIKKETGELFTLINESYINSNSEDYNEVQKWVNDLTKKLREIRHISNLNLVLSILNEWVDIHKIFSYLLFIIMFFHIIATVYWGYSWIF